MRPSGARLLILVALLTTFACGDGGAGGRRIVFQSDRSGNLDVYSMAEDGSDARPLAQGPGRDYEPDVSPDGKTIVFVSDREDRSPQLYLMDRDGGNARRLSFSAREGASVVDDYPHWAPDGRRIVFQRTRIREGKSDADIWLIDMESGEETQLTDTPDAWDSTPSFLADGRGVVFESNRDGDFDIYRLDLASGRLVNLTNAEGTDLEAKASHDGARIVFASDRDGDFEVYVMDVDGGNVQQLTENEGAEDRCPHWSPDDGRISFFSNRDGDREIYVMRADRSAPLRLTTSPGNDEVPAWAD